jgi:putative transposase
LNEILTRVQCRDNAFRRDRSHDATNNKRATGDKNCSVATPVAMDSAAYKTWGRRRSIRLKDFDYTSPGVVYHITIGTPQKQSFFTKPSINQQIIYALKKSTDLYRYQLIAYCLMPDHLHILAQAGEHPKDLREFVRGFKSYCSVATRVATKNKLDNKLWQRGFYEHILRKEENVAETAEYILNNPIRRGLVQDRERYKWCELIEQVATS